MKAKILIVSQDLDGQKLLSKTLEDLKHTVKTSDVPATTVTKCKEEYYDLVFVDAHIREIPHEQLVMDIKKACPETEIVIITSYAFPESVAKGEALDIIGYLIQPLSEAKIKNITNRALRQGELARENRRLMVAVTAAKKEWEATVDAIEDPIFITDFDYNILRANLATFRELGKGVNEVIGKKCYEIFHCSSHALDNCPGKQARDTGEPVSETISFKGLKQRRSCNVYPQVFVSGGGLVHYLREAVSNVAQQAETMAKYERLFDDARIPILFVDGDDYKVIDANRRAIEIFGYTPEIIFDMDLENLFAQSLRETAIDNIIEQVEKGATPLKMKILNEDTTEHDAFVVANPVEIGSKKYIQLFVIPVNLFSSSRDG
jgi:PAS domain S-box-containing protein